MRSQEHREHVRQFIQTAEAQIVDQKILINELNAKLFFDLYFDTYLVSKENLEKPYIKDFNSHLFKDQFVSMQFEPKIGYETPQTFALSSNGKFIIALAILVTLLKQKNDADKYIQAYISTQSEITIQLPSHIEQKRQKHIDNISGNNNQSSIEYATILFEDPKHENTSLFFFTETALK